MNKLMVEDKLIQIFDGTHPIHRESKNVITRVNDNKYVIARIIDTKHALMELMEICESDKQLINLLHHEELTELRNLYEYTFSVN